MRHLFATLALLCLSLFSPSPASAQEAAAGGATWNLGGPCSPCAERCESDRQLIVKFSPYGWLTRMHGTVGARGVDGPLDISLGKMWDLDTHDLNMAFIGKLEVTYGRLGFLVDAAYFELSPGTEIRNFQFASDVSQTGIDFDLTYTLFGQPESPCGCQHFRFDAIAGVRYYNLTGELTVTGPLGNQATFGGARDWTDLVAGGRFIIPLNDKLTLSARGDLGGFGIDGCSQLSWNVELQASYRCSDCLSIFGGYRWIDVDYTRGSGNERFRYDVQTDGPQVGVTFRF